MRATGRSPGSGPVLGSTRESEHTAIAMHADHSRRCADGAALPRVGPTAGTGRVSRPGVSRLVAPRQVRFVVTGLLAVVADYGTFVIGYSALGADIAVATVASFIAGLVVSFGLNKLWVFESRGDSIARSLRQLSLYGALLVVNIVVTYYVIAGLQHYAAVDPRVGKLICIALITAWNYPLYGRIIFSKGSTGATVR